MTSRKSTWLKAACTAVLSFAASWAGAQDNSSVGIVRISDGRTRTAAQPASFHGHGYYGGQNAYCDNCPTGNCPTGNCYGNCYGRSCNHSCLFQEHYCSNSPDHGYSPPAKYPLHRTGVQYNTYFPARWYGTPGAVYASGYPMVYQPTDTTQLGFYYQHVPFWQPNPGMMPQRPIPGNMHIVAPTVSASNFHGARWAGYPPYYGAMACPNGDCPFMQTGPMPQGQPGAPTPVPTSTTTPNATAPVPEAAAPRQFEDSAESGHIRRASF